MPRMKTGSRSGIRVRSGFFSGGRRAWRALALVLLLIAGITTPLRAADAGAMETLYPDTTAMFIAVDDVALMQSQWDQTGFSRLSADPTMEGFTANLRQQMEERWGRLGAFAGIGWDDFLAVSGGGVAMGTIPSVRDAITPDVTENLATEVVLISIVGKVEEAKKLLERISVNVQNHSGKVSTLRIGVNGDLPATCHELPRPKGWRRQAPPTLYSAFYGDWLLISDNKSSLYSVCQRIGRVKNVSLADMENYQKTVAMLDSDVKVDGHIRFYADPQRLAALQSDDPREQGEMSRGKSAAQIFREQGLDGMLGIAGRIDLAASGCEGLWKIAVYAPKPRKKSFAMLELIDVEELPIDTWVPRDAADCITLRLDVENVFDNFGPVFDAIAGQSGAWEEALEGLQKDPYGEQIDVRTELIACLGDRVTIASKYRMPVSTTSQRFLVAIDVKDEAALEQGLDKFFRYSPEMQKNRKLGNIMIRERDPSAQMTPDDLERPGFSRPRNGTRNPSRTAESEQREFFPNRAIAVANGKLWIASHLDILQEVLAAEPKNGFGDSVEAKLVDRKFAELDARRRGMRMTFKLDESIRNDYELMRMRQFEQSQSFAGRIFASILPGLENPDHLRFDLSSAPEFGYLRRFLGPGGLEVATVENGWIVRGILLPK
ncbi:MAG: hypothetical protein Q4C47_02165 [Planctomycetia bacterium]|nr:hypothetical protein [Planctomycetia bacterium]